MEPLDLSFLTYSKKYNTSDSSVRDPKSPQLSNNINQVEFELGKNILSKLDNLQTKMNISPYLLGKSILALLLYKYTGQDSFYISFYPNKEESSQLHDLTLYDFNKINNILDVIKQSSEFIAPLKQKNSSYSNLLLSCPEFCNVLFFQSGLNSKILQFNHKEDKSKYLLKLKVPSELVVEQIIEKQKIHYIVRYKKEKINKNILEEFIKCYKKLFIEILDELLQSNSLHNLKFIKSYTLLTPQQHKRTIYTWNNNINESCLYDKTVDQLFEEQVKKTPENIAIICGDVRLSYKELSEKANKLAIYLLNNYSIKPDTLIGLCLNRNERMFVTMLAVLKSGAAFVPINPDNPNERIRLIIKDINAELILTNKFYEKRLLKIDAIEENQVDSCQTRKKVNIIALDDENIEKTLSLIKSSYISTRSLAKNTNLAYVIYTSGTTGKPKGVMIEHRSYVATIDYMKRRHFSYEDHINTYSMTNYAFDMIGPEYGLPLLTGGTITIGSNDFDCLDCSRFNFIQMTPSFCNVKLDNLTNINSTKLLVGAESLSRDLLIKALKKPMDVVHLYGPTETTVWSTSNYYSKEENTDSLSVILGKPFDNEKVYILDKNLNPLPVGGIGELYIGGIWLARGYLNRSALTAEKFIPNPFHQIMRKGTIGDASRLYKTGDLCRWLPDGKLEYIGRNDFQVKIRGYRIELKEIESCLLQYEGIKESIVVAKERLNKDGSLTEDKYLIGYYVSAFKLDEAKILDHLKSRLTEYMVPSFLVYLPNLPLNINGKIDRKSLPDPALTYSDYIAPRNSQEAHLCSIWAEILSLPSTKISIEDNFFKLGGDSILVIRLVSKINKEFNCQIKAKDIFETQCISKLTEIISALVNTDKKEKSYIPFSLVKVEEYKVHVSNLSLIEDIYPASHLQTEMILRSANDHSDFYRIVSPYFVDAPFDKNKLLSILEKLVEKHELLRASFIWHNNLLSVVIFKSIKINYEVYKDENTKYIMEKEKSKKFDYETPGLFKITINDFEKRFDLILTIHHAIEDGWSMASLINEIEQAYINNEAINTNLTLRYGEFIRNEQNAITDHNNMIFWKQYLNNFNFTRAVTGYQKKNVGEITYSSFANLNSDEVDLIHKMAKKLSISIDTIFLLAYLKTLSYCIKSEDITVGLMVNNRLEKEEGDTLFGLFLNTIPFRHHLSNQKDNVQELLTIFYNKIKLQQYKTLPYEFIKAKLRNDIYDFVFNFVHFHLLKVSTSKIKSIEGHERTEIPFTLTVVQKTNMEFLLNISALEGYTSQSYVNDFMGYYKKCINDILKIE